MSLLFYYICGESLKLHVSDEYFYIYNVLFCVFVFSGQLYPRVPGQHLSGWLFCPEAEETEPPDQLQFPEGEKDWSVDRLKLLCHLSVCTCTDRCINEAWQSHTYRLKAEQKWRKRLTRGNGPGRPGKAPYCFSIKRQRLAVGQSFGWQVIVGSCSFTASESKRHPSGWTCTASTSRLCIPNKQIKATC